MAGLNLSIKSSSRVLHIYLFSRSPRPPLLFLRRMPELLRASMAALNPDAPCFFPSSFVAAEDFSPEWWHLVQTSPAFREYWLRERYDLEDFTEEMDSDSDMEGFDDDNNIGDFQIVDAACFREWENIPPPPSAKDDVRRLLVTEEVQHTQAKMNVRSKIPLFQEKPSKIVHNHPKKDATRRIQQPR